MINKKNLEVGDIVILRNGQACILTPCYSGKSMRELVLLGRKESSDNLYIELSKYDDDLLFEGLQRKEENRKYDIMTIIKGEYYAWRNFFDANMSFICNVLISTMPEDYVLKRDESEKQNKYTIVCRILYNLKTDPSGKIISDSISFDLKGNELLKLMNSLPNEVNNQIKELLICPVGEATIEIDIAKDGEYFDRDEYDGYITPDGEFKMEA